MWHIACLTSIYIVLLVPVSSSYAHNVNFEKNSIQTVELEAELSAYNSTNNETFDKFDSEEESTTRDDFQNIQIATTDVLEEYHLEETSTHESSRSSQEMSVAVVTPRGKFADLYPIEEWKKNGWLNDEYEQTINVYWMDFPPPSNDAHYAFAAIYFILTVVGLSGNLLVFTMVVSFRQLRTPSNCLVANLAVADFFMMSRGPIFIYNCFHFGPVTGYWGCQIYGVVGGLTGIGAIMSLAAIAKDRYSVIVHPFDPAYKLTKRKAIVTITLIWTYAGIFSTLPLTCGRLGVKPYLPEGYMTSCSFDYVSELANNRIFILCLFLGAWFVPFTIISSSYYRIARHFSTVSVARLGQERQQRRGEVRLTAVVLMVIVVWFLSWTPYATVALIGISGNRHLLTPFWTMVPAVFCKTAASIDPFLYALSHPRFRTFLFKIWCPRKYEERRIDVAINYQLAVWRSEGSIRFARKESVETVENPIEVTYM